MMLQLFSEIKNRDNLFRGWVLDNMHLMLFLLKLMEIKYGMVFHNVVVLKNVLIFFYCIDRHFWALQKISKSSDYYK